MTYKITKIKRKEERGTKRSKEDKIFEESY